MQTWSCTIGEVKDVPEGADGPMRAAVAHAYFELTGKHPRFIFSGWGAELTDIEREVVEESEARRNNV